MAPREHERMEESVDNQGNPGADPAHHPRVHPVCLAVPEGSHTESNSQDRGEQLVQELDEHPAHGRLERTYVRTGCPAPQQSNRGIRLVAVRVTVQSMMCGPGRFMRGNDGGPPSAHPG